MLAAPLANTIPYCSPLVAYCPANMWITIVAALICCRSPFSDAMDRCMLLPPPNCSFPGSSAGSTTHACGPPLTFVTKARRVERTQRQQNNAQGNRRTIVPNIEAKCHQTVIGSEFTVARLRVQIITGVDDTPRAVYHSLSTANPAALHC